jgi:hypothetical protein
MFTVHKTTFITRWHIELWIGIDQAVLDLGG